MIENPPFNSVRKRPNAMGQNYEIVSIQRTEPPPDGKGSNWYRYEIAFEGSITITGCRQGNLKDVTSGVVEMIAQVNKRHSNEPTPRASLKL